MIEILFAFVLLIAAYNDAELYDIATKTVNQELVNVNEDKLNTYQNDRPNIPNIPIDEEILDYLWEKCEENDVSYTLMLAIAKVESNFDIKAKNINKNKTTDGGLFQINSANVKWLAELAGIKEPNVSDPYHNIDLAIELIKYERDFWLSQGYSEEDTYWLTVYSYHRGRGNALKMASKEVWNSKYVDKVTEIKYELEGAMV